MWPNYRHLEELFFHPNTWNAFSGQLKIPTLQPFSRQSLGSIGENILLTNLMWGFAGSTSGKRTHLLMQEPWREAVPPLVQEDPLEKEMVTHSSTAAWESHGQRSLVGYSPWGSQKSWKQLSD